MKKFVLHSQNCIDNINLYRDNFGDYLINEVLAESILKELYNYPIITRDIFQHSLYEILTENNNNKENNILINACSFDYLVFKDKFLIKNNPHLILDGSVFIAKILGIKNIDIVLKDYYLEEKDILLKAIVEFEDSKFTNDIKISLYDEELYYQENKIRITPHYLENKKYVFDLETIAQFTYLAHIGELSFKNYGSSSIKGTYILSLSGDIIYPNVYEFEIGKSFKDIVKTAGNFDKDYSIKCVFTNGFLNPPMDIDTFFKMNLDYDITLGNGGICFIREDRCIIRVVLKIVKFAKTISCKKCMPCNYGFDLCEYYINRILLGKSIFSDYSNLKDTVNMIYNLASCLYIKSLAYCILSTIEMFKDEFLYAVENKITLYSFI